MRHFQLWILPGMLLIVLLVFGQVSPGPPSAAPCSTCAVGPGSSGAGNLAAFGSTNGLNLVDSGYNLNGLAGGQTWTGGTGAGDDLNLVVTSGAAAAGSQINFNGGTAGATNLGSINANTGIWTVSNPGATTYPFVITGNAVNNGVQVCRTTTSAGCAALTVQAGGGALLGFGAAGASGTSIWNSAGTMTAYQGRAVVGNGFSAESGASDLTGQVAAQASTALYTPAVNGYHRVSYYAKVTTAATTSSILGGTTAFVVNFNDGTDNTAQSMTCPGVSQAGTLIAIGTGNIGNTTTSLYVGACTVYARTAVAMTYSFGYSSTGGTPMAYEIHVRVEQM